MFGVECNDKKNGGGQQFEDEKKARKNARGHEHVAQLIDEVGDDGGVEDGVIRRVDQAPDNDDRRDKGDGSHGGPHEPGRIGVEKDRRQQRQQRPGCDG